MPLKAAGQPLFRLIKEQSFCKLDARVAISVLRSERSTLALARSYHAHMHRAFRQLLDLSDDFGLTGSGKLSLSSGLVHNYLPFVQLSREWPHWWRRHLNIFTHGRTEQPRIIIECDLNGLAALVQHKATWARNSFGMSRKHANNVPSNSWYRSSWWLWPASPQNAFVERQTPRLHCDYRTW